jgi:hypothetical protein
MLLECFRRGDGSEALFLHETPSPAPRRVSNFDVAVILSRKNKIFRSYANYPAAQILWALFSAWGGAF